MELQRILAKDSRAAMDKVFELYGQDALVVSNKKANEKTEIIVAIEVPMNTQQAINDLHMAPVDQPNSNLQGRRDLDGSELTGCELKGVDLKGFNDESMDAQGLGAVSFDADAFELEGSNLKGYDFSASQDFDQVMETHVFKTTPTSADEQFRQSLPDFEIPAQSSLNPNALTHRPLTLDPLLQDADVEHREHLQAREIVDLVKQEFEVMRKEFKLSQQLDAWSGTQSVRDEMRPLIEAFNETGMPAGLRALLSDTVNSSNNIKSAIAEISSVLGGGIEHVNLLDNMQGIHVIAGSSGSGKSLMAGRLAKQKALRCDGQDVAIISYNDSRFGAWNQTQLIGSQAGVDCFRANTPEMLEQLLQELGSRSLILIDTAGVDVKAQIKELNQLLPEAQKHLVLAADASEASINRQLKTAEGEWDSVMLSRLEDGIHPWPIINALLNTDTPVSVAAAEPSISTGPMALTGMYLAEHSLTNLPGC